MVSQDAADNNRRVSAARRCSATHVGLGSWSCKNVLAVALTPRDIGDVAVCGHFQRLVDFSAWNLF
jgi:hypothetical protein